MAGYHQLNIQIFNKDTNPNNLMAEGVVDLTKVLREKEHDGYFPLTFRGRPGTGVIYLELTFYSAVCHKYASDSYIINFFFYSKTLLLHLSSK
jgi:hypothetical protein